MISLGCPRNLVDSEIMLGLLAKRGYRISEDIKLSDVAIVNTCAFIDEAKKESIDIILQLARLKKEGSIKVLIVAGCLAQRYPDSLSGELREVDAFVGTGDYIKITDIVKKTLNSQRVFEINKPDFIYNHSTPRLFITPKHFSYLKISEGCNNHCSFCIISKLRGKYRSRPIESILKEAGALSKMGTKELNLISQDTTFYGKDIYQEFKLADLLERLAKKRFVPWIRLLYAHPAHFTDRLIKTIADYPSVCKYIDLPLQHIDDKILSRMKRRINKAGIIKLIDKLKKTIPGLMLRTTFIVGFPGETEKQFKGLLGFMKQVRFERLGIFTYSKEEGTPAFSFSPQVPRHVKRRRFNQAMSLQQDISREINRGFLGREIDVLVDEIDDTDPDLAIGRSMGDAPEVDGQVFVRTKQRKLKAGSFLRTKIIDTYEYDLVGEDTGV
ncbi:MAG: 30S ribosomal protein S12 methylthiotransferase RimO [Candidatus Omnitrophota bacterium]|nr:30S ribosomal protein S12 methylthiotransferase RimO [Candidatus Omnitrophota bacterium]